MPKRLSASVSAVLVIKEDSRLFAFTFGHGGRSMLSSLSYELDFGLRVVLNRVDVEKLRSVDTKNLEDVVISTRKQASQDSGLGAFSIDISRDMLKGVVGNPTQSDFYKRIAGADSATFSTELEFEKLGEICEDLLDAYQSDDYKKNFGFIDRIRPVREKPVIEELDNRLLDAIRTKDIGSMHLAPSRIVDWDKMEEFSFGGSGQRSTISSEELSLVNYIANFKPSKLANLTVDAIRRHPIFVKYSSADTFVKEFNVYECIIWQTETPNGLFTLMDGSWFKIDTNFAKQVTSLAKDLTDVSAFLPKAENNEKEGEYNKSVSLKDSKLALLDQKMIKTKGMISAVECCDLFSLNREFIHVKKRNSSATLSHLFSQGSVSAELFFQVPEFRSELKNVLRKDNFNQHIKLVPDGKPLPSDYHVVYAIIAKFGKNGVPPELPFFSAVNLYQHHERLKRLGVNVSVRYVSKN